MSSDMTSQGVTVLSGVVEVGIRRDRIDRLGSVDVVLLVERIYLSPVLADVGLNIWIVAGERDSGGNCVCVILGLCWAHNLLIAES